MNKTIYERIYDELDSLVGNLPAFLHGNIDHLKIESPGYMDLHIDRIASGWIALAHNVVKNGDIMADPDMEILVHEENRTAEAWAIQQDSMGLFVVAYPKPGFVDIQAKKALNDFLLQWLSELREQGFYASGFAVNMQAEPIRT